MKISSSATLALLLAWAICEAADPTRPNIVFILADDLGWTDLGGAGSKYYETPRIDGLAHEGMRFTSYYNSQNCAPTRAALLTGQYAPRTGIYTVQSLERGSAGRRRMHVPQNVTLLSLDRRTLADVLKSAGYSTGMFGKWQLGTEGDRHPSRRGFDEAIVSEGRHFGFSTDPPVAVPAQAYLADWITDRGIDFIERHRQEPFFLYLSHFAVHSPHQAKPELIERYRSKPGAAGHNDPVYAAMIQSLDESVGRITDRLESLGIRGRTIVIFSSDNGGVGGYDTTEPPGERRGITDNKPLRGGKGTLYEGGIRVPFIVSWPGVVAPGRLSDTPVIHVDILPTLAELAGAALPGHALDGVSFAPLLKSPSAGLRREALFHHFPGYLESYVRRDGWRTTPVGVIRAGDWKLMEFYEDGRLELYNLKDDIGESNNRAAEMPAKALEMKQRLAAWRGELNAAMPKLKDPAAPTPAP